MNIQAAIPRIVFLKRGLFIVLLFFVVPVFGQITGKNLVPNSGFEDYKGTRPRPIIRSARPWMNVGTVDWFPKTDVNDTSFFKGPHSGKSYVGMRFQNKYKEFAYVKLLGGKLKKGQTYYFSMYARLSSASTVSIKQLGVYFSSSPVRSESGVKDEGLVDSTYEEGITGDLGWIPISGKYTANGKERYVMIGNFGETDMVKRKGSGLFKLKEAYYYIDDVVLLDTSYHAPIPVVGDSTMEDSTVTFNQAESKSVYFQNGSSEMEESSKQIAEQVIALLGLNKSIHVNIIGHTDSRGNEELNLKLSKKRAKEVYYYLLKRGVQNEMTVEGYGSSMPIAPNNTEKGRYLNRRVEISVIKDLEE